jgi:hypothetical protein
LGSGIRDKTSRIRNTDLILLQATILCRLWKIRIWIFFLFIYSLNRLNWCYNYLLNLIFEKLLNW